LTPASSEFNSREEMSRSPRVAEFVHSVKAKAMVPKKTRRMYVESVSFVCRAHLEGVRQCCERSEITGKPIAPTKVPRMMGLSIHQSVW
jgi:hypothetical protein